MSIITKTGDNGNTNLWSGERVKKNSPRVEAYGTVDELSSHLSEAQHVVKSDHVKKIIKEILDDLFNVGGDLASIGNFMYPIRDEDIERISNYVHEFEKGVELTGFVVPGNTPQSAKLDVCRTVARRAERRILTLADEENVPIPTRKYINRLSDLLYIMARFEEKNEGQLEFKKWNP